MTATCDFAIVGAGMAGASLAAALAPHGRVVVIEAEERPGFHATGRSAAFWTQSYGGPQVLPLTMASGPFLEGNGLLVRRGALTLARRDELAGLEQFARQYAALGVTIEELDRPELLKRLRGLRTDWVAGVLEPDCCDIDVAALHQLWLGEARRGGVEIRCSSHFLGATRTATGWMIRTGDGVSLRARILIDAAGAWADDIAERSGVRPLGIMPFRRTMAQLRTSPVPPVDLPLVLGIDGSFYFKPEGGRLWLSPHDEIPSAPCDAAPEELDVAIAIDRFEGVVDWRIEAVEHRWAGLRSFAPDRLPVYGFDLREPAFFWFAGQGGFGIQTAPAAAALAADLILDRPASGSIDPAWYAPTRFG
jgi:D-arginine dehydrogenase